MNKLISVLLLIIPLVCFSQEKPNITLTGILNNPKGGEEIHLKMNASNIPPIATSGVSSDGSFTLSAFIPDADLFRLQLSDENFISMIIEPGETINVQADADNLKSNLNISGSTQTTLLYTAGANINAYQMELDSINKNYRLIQKSGADMKDLAVMSSEYTRINTEKTNYIIDFINTNQGSLACLFFIDKLDIGEHFKIYDFLDKSLIKKYPENIYVKNLHSMVEGERSLTIGSLAPEIILPDPDSNLKKLSSLRGSIVLIDFWAGWCGPCRKENPNVVRLYEKYHNKGFDVFGVSLDKTRDSWLNAIENDKLTWTQVSDLKYWKSEAAALYHVKSIPHTVLIDREGRIIGKKLRGQALEEKLEELLGE